MELQNQNEKNMHLLLTRDSAAAWLARSSVGESRLNSTPSCHLAGHLTEEQPPSLRLMAPSSAELALGPQFLA